MVASIRMTDFKLWLCNQSTRDDAIGDLARDVVLDLDWPPVASEDDIREYIRIRAGSNGLVLPTLETALEQWRQEAS